MKTKKNTIFTNIKRGYLLSAIAVLMVLLLASGLYAYRQTLRLWSVTELLEKEKPDSRSASYYPYKLNFDVGETVRIYYADLSDDFSLGKWEFCLWALPKGGEWERVVPYQDLAQMYDTKTNVWLTSNQSVGTFITSYTFTEAGVVSLQVDVREKENGHEKKMWLGEFYAREITGQRDRTFLMRDILASYQDVFDERELYNCLAYDLYAAAGAYYYAAMGNQEAAAAHVGTIPDTRLLRYDGEMSALIYENNIVPLQPGTIPPFDECMKLFKDKTPDFVIAAMINTAVYNHYEYGSPVSGIRIHDPRNWIAHCGYFTKDLYSLLSAAGYYVDWVNVSVEGDRVHAVCEVTFPDGVYTFDPTVNVIYNAPAREIYLEETNVYWLPQVRNLDFLTDKAYWDAITNIDTVLTR